MSDEGAEHEQGQGQGQGRCGLGAWSSILGGHSQVPSSPPLPARPPSIAKGPAPESQLPDLPNNAQNGPGDLQCRKLWPTLASRVSIMAQNLSFQGPVLKKD